MNEDLRRIFEMLAAINTRLEINERLTRQIDEQLALLNIKREHELEETRACLSKMIAAVETIKAAQLSAEIQNGLQNFAAALENLRNTQNNEEIISNMKKLTAAVAAMKNAKADELATLRVGLQNSNLTLNDLKKRVDNLKFDTAKKFKELEMFSDINHKAIMNALAEIKKEIAAPEIPAEKKAEHDFEVSGWWSGDKGR